MSRPTTKIKNRGSNYAKTTTESTLGKQRTLFTYFSKISPKKDVLGADAERKRLQNHGAFDAEAENENMEIGQRKKIKLVQTQEIGSDADTPTSPTEEVLLRLVEKTSDLPIIDHKMGLSWFLALEEEFDKDYFRKLNDFVENSRRQGVVYPPPAHVWEWTRYSAIEDVKVVILGQDPYHGPGQAHGLCFSVRNVAPPPSLLNMFKELESDIAPNFKKPNHGCLVGWASQGVLLLNSVLTVNAHQANSHKDRGWEKLTDATIAWISKNLNSVVFLLWGAHAQKKAAIVDKKKHHLLQTVHPSPLSCHRGFLGCKHFSRCNALLESSGKKPIDWNHLPNIYSD